MRDLFAQAKEAAPSIIFIDELDAIGRSRQGSAAITGANDEREQTLDQILTEIDGFEPAEAVVVLAATNRPDILDPALLRAGRFDRRVAVQPPDRAGRAQILRVHTRSMPLADDVDLDALASSTPGMVGADLANLANEARAAGGQTRPRARWRCATSPTRSRSCCSARRAGSCSRPPTASAPPTTSPGTRSSGCSRPSADPVRKVSIIPRGMALGVTLSTPDADRVSYSLEELQAKIKVALGGRVAEEVVYGTITTGAESDIQQLTEIARQMVGRWGMSEAIGPVAVLSHDGQGRCCPASARPPSTRSSSSTRRRSGSSPPPAPRSRACSASTATSSSRSTQALLAAETLDAPEAYAAAGVPLPPRVEDEPAAEPAPA